MTTSVLSITNTTDGIQTAFSQVPHNKCNIVHQPIITSETFCTEISISCKICSIKQWLPKNSELCLHKNRCENQRQSNTSRCCTNITQPSRYLYTEHCIYIRILNINVYKYIPLGYETINSRVQMSKNIYIATYRTIL